MRMSMERGKKLLLKERIGKANPRQRVGHATRHPRREAIIGRPQAAGGVDDRG
jgi:hypothetical protein